MNTNYHVEFIYPSKDASFAVSNSIKLMMVLKGKVSLTFSQTKHQLSQNQLEIINFNEPHEVQSLEDDSIIVVLSISENMLDLYAPEIKNRVYNCYSSEFYEGGASREAVAELTSKFVQLVNNMLKKSSHLVTEIQSLLEYIMIHFDDINNLLNKSDSELKSDRYYNIISYIRLHLNEHIMLDDIEKEIFISKEYISREFKRLFNRTFKEIQAYYRVVKAASLLLNTKDSIEKISVSAGFSSKRYFYKYFERFYNCTPNNFRLKAKSNDSLTQIVSENTASKYIEKLISQSITSIQSRLKIGFDQLNQNHQYFGNYNYIELNFHLSDFDLPIETIIKTILTFERKNKVVFSGITFNTNEMNPDVSFFSYLINRLEKTPSFENRLFDIYISYEQKRTDSL